MPKKESNVANLEFLTTDELISELMRRHTALLIVRESETKNRPDQRDSKFDYCGSINSAIGMAYRALHEMEMMGRDTDG